MTTLLTYIPVIHQGYLQLFSEYMAACQQDESSEKKLILIPAELAREFGPTHKDLHGLSTELIQKSVASWGLFDVIEVATSELLADLQENLTPLFIPDEVISCQLVARYLPKNPVTKSSIFLRWDNQNTLIPHTPSPDEVVPETVIMELATTAGAHSSDWWRQVGAVAVRSDQNGSNTVIAQAHNTHLPSEQTPYVEGDGRAQFHKGEEIDKTTAIHAEAKLIAEAAKTGVSLAGADLYVTDFPCPTCAKLIATAGFKRVYYKKGYAVFDGERVLKTVGIQIIKVG